MLGVAIRKSLPLPGAVPNWSRVSGSWISPTPGVQGLASHSSLKKKRWCGGRHTEMGTLPQTLTRNRGPRCEDSREGVFSVAEKPQEMAPSWVWARWRTPHFRPSLHMPRHTEPRPHCPPVCLTSPRALTPLSPVGSLSTRLSHGGALPSCSPRL